VSRREDERFKEVAETTGALLRFPGDRLATFVCSFGAASVSEYDVVGTKGSLRVSPAYNIGEDIEHTLTVGEKTTKKRYPGGDQFAAELLEFSDCVRTGREPEPSGEEGLADVRVLEALDEAGRSGKRIELAPFACERHPDLGQQIRRPRHDKADLVHVQKPDRSATS
jgi:glucose-fructose oxidoreductase